MRINSIKKTLGYTLVEMLVVMSIIAILLSVGASSIKNLATSKGVDVGVPIMKSVFKEARQKAITSGEATRVLIYLSGGDGTNKEKLEKFCRYVAVAVDDGTGTFEVTSKPVSLPEQCYFDADLSQGDATVTITLPGDSSTSTCAFWEYNALGIPSVELATSSTTPTTSKVILNNGRVRLNSGSFELVTSSAGEREYQGFALTKHGELPDIKELDNLD